ncbi:MAG TPA: hypothetical protein VL119_05750 [Acidimicrobiia bacterium]|nr:hypothetical protein [Acidimicrobiia bacterium]
METRETPSQATDSAARILERASELGFVLVHHVTSSGQSVWEWRRADQPPRQFVTERVAIDWMAEHLPPDSGPLGATA